MTSATHQDTSDQKNTPNSSASTPPTEEGLKTPLFAWHQARGAKMVPFAGYAMPVQYPLGIMGEHLFTREKAGLFDVSHMGQCRIFSSDWEKTARFLETLVPADILGLKPGQQRYSQFLAPDGGILDDLMITREDGTENGAKGAAFLVVNAGCKAADFAHLAAHLPQGFVFQIVEDHALLALQGPEAVFSLAKYIKDLENLPFMVTRKAIWNGVSMHISRSGYTGEDGVEISLPAAKAIEFCEELIKNPNVQPIGLGARDSLRLEAGLCLYGHDIDTTTSPIEAGLIWSIQKRRREEGGFPGASRIQQEIKQGATRLRVGLRLAGRQPAREGAEIWAKDRKIGVVTSGGFAPSMQVPIAMGYVERAFAEKDTKVALMVRGKTLDASICPMPFVPSRYYRG